MGNSLSGPISTRPYGAVDSFVSDLGNDIVYEKSLGASRFLKAVKCIHRNGPLVVKVFIKPDPGLSLRTYARRLKVEREALADILNVYNYKVFVENDRAGYIVRQWLDKNLYDRISTRPFLSSIEKKWIAFQLLNGMKDARRRNVSHGDIKSENILVTSWNWVYLTDFASYKPTFLPLDDPADFSLFFDTSGRRTCYIAPERFYAAGSEISKKKANLDFDKRDGKISEAMDVFSLGCVIAELFLEGAPMFTLSQLYKYRTGEFNVESHISSIEDEEVKNLILRMVALDPAERPTFDLALHSSRGTVFPESFYSFLHNYMASLNELSSQNVFSKTGTLTPSDNAFDETTAMPTDSDHRINKVWGDYDLVEPYLTQSDTQPDALSKDKGKNGPQRLQDIFPVELYIPNRLHSLSDAINADITAAAEDGTALIMLSFICANIRNCLLPSSKLKASDMLLALAPHLTDEAKLDRLIPYVMDLLHDDAAIVRGAAIRTLMQVLMLVKAITPSNASIFPEYILPNIRYLYKDPDVSVRCVLAQCIAPLADTSLRYLEMGQALKAHGTFKLTVTDDYEDALYEVSYDASLQDLQSSIQDILVSLLVDNSSVVKRAVLQNVSSLCIFLGRQRTNDVLLGHMITYLNDRDWLLRYAFFESIVDVAACVGARSLEEYILPLMVQALSDEEENVIVRVLISLTSLSELCLFQRMRLWELMSATLGFVYHPNIWIRQNAIAFIVSATNQLPSVDTWCILYPSLRPLLRSDIKSVTVLSVLQSLKPPLSRPIFDATLQWAMKADKTNFWKIPRSRTTSKAETSKETFVTNRKSANTRHNVPRTEEDEANMAKLQQLGLTPQDEVKLLSLRDYIIKLAHVISSSSARTRDLEPETSIQTINGVELQKLGVVPQTVFVATKSSEGSIKTTSSRRTTFDNLSRQSPIYGNSRVARLGSVEHVDDLRRKITSINNGSGVSPILGADRDRRISSTPSTLDLPAASADNRPASPTESAVSSTVEGSLLRQRTHLHIGSTDNQKAPAAIGSIKTNVSGVLELPITRIEDEFILSGRSSPVSNAGTLRADHRSTSTLRPYPLSTETRDQGLTNLLDHFYNEGLRDSMQDFGPKVHETPIRRRNTPRQSNFSLHGSSRRPEAFLVANLSSHTGAINGIAVAPDHAFFVTCSDDKTVKVWDTARLERNITSKPRQTYAQHHARVTAVCMLEGFHCFASAGDDGSLHVVRVHVLSGGSMPKYGKLQIVREHRVEQPKDYITCLTHYNTEMTSNILYTTAQSTITILDIKSMRILHTMENPRHFGPIATFCIDKRKSWLVVATITGVLSLWDIRFGLLIKSWKANASTLSGRSLKIHKCTIYPSKGKGRWIIVALEVRPTSTSKGRSMVLMEVWDIESTTLMETFETRDLTSENAADTADTRTEDNAQMVKVAPVQEAEKDPANAIAALVRSRAGANIALENTTPTITEDSNSNTTRQSSPWPQPDICALIGGADISNFLGSVLPRPSDFTSGDAALYTERRSGYLITGSEDRKLRLWDLGNVERSVLLSGGETEGERPTFRTIRDDSKDFLVHTETSSPGNTYLGNQNQRAASRTNVITQHQHNLLRAHQDCITAVSCIDSPFRGGIVSGDRAGLVKVWRIEEAF